MMLEGKLFRWYERVRRYEWDKNFRNIVSLNLFPVCLDYLPIELKSRGMYLSLNELPFLDVYSC